ncbi:MAG: pyrroline-5-carboxylate reductase family protein [Ignavibacterium sp.]
MKNIEERKISFIGGGSIAEVFINRLIESGFVFQNNIMVSDIKAERLDYIKEKYCVQVTKDNSEAASFGNFVFLAVPPPQVKVVLSENCKDLRKDQILISLAAAIPLWLIDSVLCKEVAVVRVIPNTPSQIGKGVNPYCLGKYMTEEQISDAEKILEVFGNAVKIDESQINIATALTAVGPTYWFPAIQSLIDFGIKQGLSREVAFELVNDTLSGTAELVKKTLKDPDELKLQIGTRTINEEEVKRLFAEAIETAFNKVINSEKKLTE